MHLHVVVESSWGGGEVVVVGVGRGRGTEESRGGTEGSWRASGD